MLVIHFALEVRVRARANTTGSQGERFPSAETLRIVQDALARYLAGEDDDERVCQAFHVLAREADARHLRAEGVLAAFRAIWHELPQVQGIDDAERRAHLLAHLVKLCINTYYTR